VHRCWWPSAPHRSDCRNAPKSSPGPNMPPCAGWPGYPRCAGVAEPTEPYPSVQHRRATELHPARSLTSWPPPANAGRPTRTDFVAQLRGSRLSATPGFSAAGEINRIGPPARSRTHTGAAEVDAVRARWPTAQGPHRCPPARWRASPWPMCVGHRDTDRFAGGSHLAGNGSPRPTWPPDHRPRPHQDGRRDPRGKPQNRYDNPSVTRRNGE